MLGGVSVQSTTGLAVEERSPIFLEMGLYFEIITVRAFQSPPPQLHLVPVSQTKRVRVQEERGIGAFGPYHKKCSLMASLPSGWTYILSVLDGVQKKWLYKVRPFPSWSLNSKNYLKHIFWFYLPDLIKPHSLQLWNHVMRYDTWPYFGKEMLGLASENKQQFFEF